MKNNILGKNHNLLILKLSLALFCVLVFSFRNKSSFEVHYYATHEIQLLRQQEGFVFGGTSHAIIEKPWPLGSQTKLILNRHTEDSKFWGGDLQQSKIKQCKAFTLSLDLYIEISPGLPGLLSAGVVSSVW